MVGDGVGDQQHAQSGAAHTPTEIDVVAKQRQGRVEATEAVPHVTPNEHARAGDREDMPVPVVLAVVELTLFQAGLAASRSVDGHTDLDEQAAVEPVAELGSQDRCARVLVGRPQQLGEGVRLRGEVVVDQPEPLRGFFTVRAGHGGGRARKFEGSTHRVPVPGVGGQRHDRFRGQVIGEDVRAVVGAAGVGGHDSLQGAGLLSKCRQRLGQPAGPVVGHDDSGDDVVIKILVKHGCGGSLPERGGPASPSREAKHHDTPLRTTACLFGRGVRARHWPSIPNRQSTVHNPHFMPEEQ